MYNFLMNTSILLFGSWAKYRLRDKCPISSSEKFYENKDGKLISYKKHLKLSSSKEEYLWRIHFKNILDKDFEEIVYPKYINKSLQVKDTYLNINRAPNMAMVPVNIFAKIIFFFYVKDSKINVNELSDLNKDLIFPGAYFSTFYNNSTKSKNKNYLEKFSEDFIKKSIKVLYDHPTSKLSFEESINVKISNCLLEIEKCKKELEKVSSERNKEYWENSLKYEYKLLDYLQNFLKK